MKEGDYLNPVLLSNLLRAEILRRKTQKEGLMVSFLFSCQVASIPFSHVACGNANIIN